MPTKTRKARPAQGVDIRVTPQGEDSVGAETEEVTEEERIANEQIEAASGTMPKAAEAIIYRYGEDGKEGLLDTVAAGLITAEYISREYGGGKYRIQFRKPNATGKMTFGPQKEFDIDRSIPSQPPKWARRAAIHNPDGSVVGGASGREGSSSTLDAMMLSMFQQQTSFIQTLQSERGSKPSVDWSTIIPAATGLLSTLVTVMMSRKSTIEEMAPLLALMKSEKSPHELALEIAKMASDSRAPSSNIKETLETLTLMREAMGDLGGEKRSTMDSLLEHIAPKALEIIAQAQSSQGASSQAPAGAGGRGAPEPAHLPAGTEHTGGGGDSMWQKMLSAHIPQVVKLAQAGRDPETYAEVFLDNFPSNFYGLLDQFLARPTLVEDVLTAYPVLEPYREWATTYLLAIRDMRLGVEEESGEVSEEGGAPRA